MSFPRGRGAALIADALVRSWRDERERATRVMLAIVATLIALAGGLVLWLFRDGYYAIVNPWLVAGLCAAIGLVALVATLRRQPRHAVIAIALGFVAINYLFVLRVLPGLERLKPTPTLAAAFLARASADAKLGFYDFSLPSLTFYSGRDVEDISSVESSTAFFRRPQESYAINWTKRTTCNCAAACPKPVSSRGIRSSIRRQVSC